MSLLSFQLPDKIVMEKADDFHGIFTFSPLQPGYGLTIGNAVRRVLLSSLEGYAVTGIKIPGIQHEFSTIDGIVEDVSEIILNLKNVRFKATGENPEKSIVVKFDSKGTLTAQSIEKSTSSFKVLNPKHEICTLSKKVKFTIELRVEKGRGYVTSEENNANSADVDFISDWTENLSAKLLSSHSVRCEPVADVTQLPGYYEGQWWVQDCTAALPARLMGNVSDKNIIDLCAAPGGKTAQLISAGANVIAIDHSATRINRLSENLNRLCLKAKIICADGRDYMPEKLVDSVLLDSPCSATGTIRRRPDVLIGKTPTQIKQLQSLQIELGIAAAKWIKSGGTLIYATCSLQKQEGEEVLEALISNEKSGRLLYPIRREEADIFYPSKRVEDTIDYLRILPNQLLTNGTDNRGNDGFFIARLKVK